MVVRELFLQTSYNSIVHDHLCDTRLPTFETLSFFAYRIYICLCSACSVQSRLSELSGLDKNQLLHGIEKLPDCWQACILCERDCIERLQCNFSLKINFFVLMSNCARHFWDNPRIYSKFPRNFLPFLEYFIHAVSKFHFTFLLELFQVFENFPPKFRPDFPSTTRTTRIPPPKNLENHSQSSTCVAAK